jgi:hypothetical protein
MLCHRLKQQRNGKYMRSPLRVFSKYKLHTYTLT